MRRTGSLVLLLAAAALAAAVWTGGATAPCSPGPWAAAAEDKPAETPSRPPPLKVDRGAPLLLDEPSKKPEKKPLGPEADNSACFVCHTNYDGEELASQHARANVGCVKCHGESHPHRNDEDNITPPDVMFPPEKIDKACQECHDTHDAPAKDVIARWRKKCPEKTDPAALVCTDCHGEHRLKQRQVVWDKRTGKLAPQKTGQTTSPTKAPKGPAPE